MHFAEVQHIHTVYRQSHDREFVRINLYFIGKRVFDDCASWGCFATRQLGSER